MLESLKNLFFEKVEDENLAGVDGLKKKKEHLIKRLNNSRKNKGYLKILSLFMIAVMSILIIMTVTEYGKYILMIGYSLLPLLLIPSVNQNIKEFETELRSLEIQIDLETFAADDKDLRYAEKTLRSHNSELQKYYDLNLNQNSWVFTLGIVCIILGFMVVMFTLYYVYHSMGRLEVQITVGIIGSISAILVNYIAALYLKMNSEINGNMKEFHARLVDTHKILLGNLIATKITDETLRNQTLSEVAKEVAK